MNQAKLIFNVGLTKLEDLTQKLLIISCELALRAPLSAGQEMVGELATMSLKFEFPSGSLLTEPSDFRQ